MKRSTLAGFFAALTLVQSVSQAQLILDLPDPGGLPGGGQQTPQTGGTATPAPVETQFAGSVSISSITRKTGGELYVVSFQNSQVINRLDLRVMSNRLKIHKATIVTSQGARHEVASLNNLPVLEIDSITSSGQLGTSQEIASLELQLESFGGASQLVVTALGQKDVPQLRASLQQQQTPDMSGLGGGGDTGLPGGFGGLGGGPVPDPNFGQTGLNNNGSCTTNGFCVNDRIAYGNSAMGYISGLTPEGRAYIRLDSDRRDRLVSTLELARIIVCNTSGICAQSRVAYDNTVGRVVGVTDQGMVFVLDGKDRQVKAVHTSRVGASTDCISNVCRGDRGLYRGKRNQVVDIYEVFTNGILTVRINNSRDIYSINLNDFWR